VKHKLPSELIAIHYLTKYARVYNWVLFIDFIQNVLQKVCLESAKIGSLLSTLGAGLISLSFHPEL